MKPTWRNVLPSTCVTLGAIVRTEDGLIIEAEGGTCGRCPGCRRTSTARHSRYWRTLKDLTAHGQSVTLRVRVSRWRCRNPSFPLAELGSGARANLNVSWSCDLRNR